MRPPQSAGEVQVYGDHFGIKLIASMRPRKMRGKSRRVDGRQRGDYRAAAAPSMPSGMSNALHVERYQVSGFLAELDAEQVNWLSQP